MKKFKLVLVCFCCALFLAMPIDFSAVSTAGLIGYRDSYLSDIDSSCFIFITTDDFILNKVQWDLNSGIIINAANAYQLDVADTLVQAKYRSYVYNGVIRNESCSWSAGFCKLGVAYFQTSDYTYRRSNF